MKRKTVKKLISDIRTINGVVLPSERPRLSVKVVKEGDTITLNKHFYLVTEKNGYADGGDEWYELKLKSLVTAQNSFLEWDEDDEISMTHYTQFPTMRELNVVSKDLDRFIENESGSFFFDDTEYFFEEYGCANFFRGMSLTSEEHNYWNFSDDSESKTITIEYWDGEFEAALGQSVDPDALLVIAQGE
ncbi:MAG: DUF4178 domain-containing protein [Fibrobacterales bacterium]